jgi:hypothetical protein
MWWFIHQYHHPIIDHPNQQVMGHCLFLHYLNHQRPLHHHHHHHQYLLMAKIPILARYMVVAVMVMMVVMRPHQHQHRCQHHHHRIAMMPQLNIDDEKNQTSKSLTFDRSSFDTIPFLHSSLACLIVIEYTLCIALMVMHACCWDQISSFVSGDRIASWLAIVEQRDEWNGGPTH